MSTKKQFLVMGLGRFGFSLAKTLAENGYDVMGVDCDDEKVQNAAEFLTHAVKADVADERDLMELGLSNFDVVVIAIGSKLESSVMGTLVAKNMGTPYVVTKANNEMHKKILEKIGADRVIFPEREMGVRLANSLMYGNFVEFMEVSDEFGIMEIEPLNEWIGKTLIESDIRRKYSLNVVAVRNSGKVDVSPAASRVFVKGDMLVVIGANDQIRRFLEKNGGA